MRPTRPVLYAFILVVCGALAAACGGSDDGGDVAAGSSGAPASGGGATSTGERATLRLVTYDSFAASPEVLQAFTDETGIGLEVLPVGDTGETLNRVILTQDRPLGDVLWGVDTTYLSRALDHDVTVPYASPELASVDARFRGLVPGDAMVPVDYGDICVNVDREWFAQKGLEPPTTLEELADPRYEGLLVTEDAATSAPGLAFLLATIARYGEDGFEDYWKRLRANDVDVVSGWTEAYTVAFSGSSGKGPRPLVVSYASSPPAEMLGIDPPPAEARTGVIEDTCFRSVEYAGIIRGTEHEAEARKLIDFLLSKRFQEDMPLQIFVFPVRADAALPDAFARYAVVPDAPATLPPDQIEANRERWIETWKSAALR